MVGTGCDRIEGGVWGCVVLVAAFLTQVVIFGTSQSIGVYTVELLDYFDAGTAEISLVGSINIGLVLGAGPLASILMTRLGCRKVAMIGAALANIGLITLPFAPNLPFMYVFYGMVTGLGYCLSYVSSHVLCGLYFYKQRGCATGIATAGIGMGTSLFPIISYNLIEHYGWQSSLFIVAGLNLNLFVFAALLRTVPKRLKESFKVLELSDERHRLQTKGTCIDIEVSEIGNTTEERGPESRLNDNYDTFNDVTPNECETFTFVKTTVNDYCVSVMTCEFILYCLSCVFWNAGSGILIIFLPEYMVISGISKGDSSLAITIFGVGNVIGCILGGLLGNNSSCIRILLYTVGNICASIATLMMVWSYFHAFVSMLLLTLLYGVMNGIIIGLLLVMTSDLLGTDALVKGFGYLMFCNGLGMFCGPPAAGLLMDATGHISNGIIFSAALTLMGAIVITIVPMKRRFGGSLN